MKITIHKNCARCRICEKIIESFNAEEYVVCSCGALAITGGKTRLGRATQSWSVLEELSEYLLSWKDVLDSKQLYHYLYEASDNAKIAGYIFFIYNGEIWRNLDNGKRVRTGKVIEDLEKEEPCIIKVKQ